MLKQDILCRKGSRLYNVPVEILRRRVTGMVDLSCKPRPSTVLTPEEEEQLYKYAVEMADHGFGLTRNDLMRLAFVIVVKSGCPNPFQDGMPGRGWMDGFRRHVTLRLLFTLPNLFIIAGL